MDVCLWVFGVGTVWEFKFTWLRKKKWENGTLRENEAGKID